MPKPKVSRKITMPSDLDRVPFLKREQLTDESLSRVPFLTGEETINSDGKFVGPLNLPHGSAEYMIKRFQNAGLTKEAALGIVGNFMVESELDPASEQKGGGPGRGLAQWGVKGRFDTDRINLVKFAKERGKPWQDLNTQLDFVMYEMDNHPEYKRVKDKINKAKTVEDATNIFLKEYEKANPKKAHADRRLNHALEFGAMVDTIPGFNG